MYSLCTLHLGRNNMTITRFLGYVLAYVEGLCGSDAVYMESVTLGTVIDSRRTKALPGVWSAPSAYTVQ